MTTAPRKSLGVYFDGCNTYGHLYLRRDGAAYLGNCPKCGAPTKVRASKSGVEVNLVRVTCRRYGR